MSLLSETSKNVLQASTQLVTPEVAAEAVVAGSLTAASVLASTSLLYHSAVLSVANTDTTLTHAQSGTVVVHVDAMTANRTVNLPTVSTVADATGSTFTIVKGDTGAFSFVVDAGAGNLIVLDGSGGPVASQTVTSGTVRGTSLSLVAIPNSGGTVNTWYATAHADNWT